jgi:diguanylate cyclase (GGDEF)-like protein/PAS domain S-box-containing protein
VNKTSAPESHAHTILIIDDTPTNLAVVVDHLEDHDFRVVIARNGPEGLKRAQFVRPDLILLDVMMPEMDGFETCRRLKAADATRDIPVIFMTALEETKDKITGFEVGGVDYVTKPFQIAEALARISTHLALHTMRKQLAVQNVQLQREIAVREQVEAALQHAYDDLEERVAQRTAELAQANMRLKGEITDRIRAEEALREREARIRRLVESNIIGVYFWGIDGETPDANDAFLRIVGYTREDLNSAKISWIQMTPPECRAVDSRAIDELRTNGSCAPYEKEYIRKDGSRVPVLIGSAFLEGSQENGIAFVLDLTEQKLAEGRIRHMAHHDALTGLPNRVLFQDRVSQAIAHAHRSQNRVGMLFIDLDHFKDINDSLGHQIGDRLLRAAARRLQRCLRTGDSVARLGGDEFVINAPALDNDNGAALIAGKALEAIRRPFFIDQHELHVTASIGISLYPTDGRDAEALMRAADTAMYYAKERGRDNYQFFTSRLNEAAQRRLTIANRLHQALQRGEFALHYQPHIDIRTGRIFSAEALIRWHQPQMGIVSPGEFVRIAEETGLIVPLGEWVLRTACEQLKNWRVAGYADLTIAVNLSPHQFRRPGFADLAARILNELELPPAALEMEITEGVLMMQTAENKNILDQLARLGIRLAVDDFGTGYSSLAYLQNFPIHALKIDQSFVSGIEVDTNDTAIVTAIIAMAHSLRLKVVAEGVETADQVDFLRQHGCDAMQGFYFSKAVPAEAFLELLGKPGSWVQEARMAKG